MSEDIVLEAGKKYANHIRVNQDRKMNCHIDFAEGAKWMWNYIREKKIDSDEKSSEILCRK